MWHSLSSIVAYTNNTIAVVKGHTLNIYSVRWAPTGKLIASGSSDKTIRLWEVVQQ